MFDALDTSASGLLAQRTRMDTIAANIANLNTTHNAQHQPVPYRRRFAVFGPGQPGNPSAAGVHVDQIVIDPSPPREVYAPGHPDADPVSGKLLLPNIDLSMEYVNALEASRAYEANITTMEVTKSMINASLRLIA